MRIIVDIDDATGAVTITPETQDPEAAIANPEAVAAEPGKERRDFHTETGARYSYDSETHTLTGYSHRSNPDEETVFLTMDVDPSGVTVGPAYSGWRWQVRPPSAPQSGVIAFNEESHDEAVAFAEWLESVGGPKFQHDEPEPELEPEPVLDTGSDPDPRDMKMPYCRYPRDREAGRYATETQHGVIESESGYYEWAESGVCACDWDPRNRALTIRWANGILDQCYRVHPDSAQLRVHQVSEGGKWSAWWPTTEGAKRAVFDTEEQAQTFVARLAEAFEKGKA